MISNLFYSFDWARKYFSQVRHLKEFRRSSELIELIQLAIRLENRGFGLRGNRDHEILDPDDPQVILPGEDANDSGMTRQNLVSSKLKFGDQESINIRDAYAYLMAFKELRPYIL
jgi:hypothetical protein